MTARSTRKQLLAAISSMDRRVTIPDVVARTGLSLSEVSTYLNELAYELKADLDVTDSGQIYYRFPKDLHYRYFSNRIMEFAYRVWIAIQPTLAFLFRISFGLLLLISITIVFIIMLILQSLMATFSGSTAEVLNLIKEFFTLFKKLHLFQSINWKFWQSIGEVNRGNRANGTDLIRSVPSSPLAQTPLNAGAEAASTGDKGFLLNCHEFLFGPGDPNKDFEKDKSKAIAQLIRFNYGIILPEELAPLTGSSAQELEGAFPVLARFHGIPGTTPSGHLVYKFPEMQAAVVEPLSAGADQTPESTQATADSKNRLEKSPPTNIKMKKLVFHNIARDSLKPILLLAVSNFCGTVFFWWLLFAVQSSDSTSQNVFLVLALYASFFLIFPGLRWTSIQLLNRRIKRYNEKIEKLEANLLQPENTLKLATNEVSKLRQDEIATLTDKLVYTTSRDYLEQESDQLFQKADDPTK